MQLEAVTTDTSQSTSFRECVVVANGVVSSWYAGYVGHLRLAVFTSTVTTITTIRLYLSATARSQFNAEESISPFSLHRTVWAKTRPFLMAQHSEVRHLLRECPSVRHSVCHARESSLNGSSY